MRPIPILLTIAAIAVPVMPIAAAEPATDPAAVTTISTTADAAVDSAFTGTAMLAEADLGAIAGREDIGTMAAVADQRNTVQGNSVTGTSVTGTVTIDGQAFQNLSGLSVISANSGNNVAINSAMNVVINLAPQ